MCRRWPARSWVREPLGARLNVIAEVYLEVAQIESADVLSELGSSAVGRQSVE